MGTRKMASDILIWIFGIIAVISLFLALKKRYIINVGDLTQEGFDKLVIPFKQPLEEHIKEKLEPLQEQLDNEINKFKLQVNKSLDKATELKKQIENINITEIENLRDEKLEEIESIKTKINFNKHIEELQVQLKDLKNSVEEIKEQLPEEDLMTKKQYEELIKKIDKQDLIFELRKKYDKHFNTIVETEEKRTGNKLNLKLPKTSKDTAREILKRKYQS